jgi:hypothetical protein
MARPVPNSVTPGFSIVLEWDNTRLARTERTRECLGRLAQQIRSLTPPPGQRPELIVAFNGEAADAKGIASALGAPWTGGSVECEIRLAPQSGLDYYQLKNAGARLARRELIIFLDSDVIPDQGWLAGMLMPFSDPRVQVVTGCAYVAPRSLYSRAVALFWYYDLKPADSGCVPTRHFYANNLAFRREMFGSHPFPDCRPMFRGHCAQLAAAFAERGVTMVAQTSSTVDHPPPNGPAHFIRRALCEGHDATVDLQRGGHRHDTTKTIGRLFRSVADSARRIRKGRRAVGLGRAGAVAALFIAATYFGLRAAGELVTRWYPAIVPRYFSI